MGMLNLQQNKLPTRKDEEWKYTNLSRALGELKDVQPESPQEIVIHKNSGQICGEIEEILWTGVDNQHHQPCLKITLEDGAQATIIERHEGEGSYWKNMSTEIKLGKNAKLNHIRIQNDSVAAVQTNMVHITMEQNAQLDSFSLNIGGKLTRHDIHALLNGSGIECSLNGVNLLRGDQHGDTTILMEHLAPHSSSNQFYRTLLDDNARGVFQGKIYVDKCAQQTDGYQLSNALMLSDKCEMDTKPELEIYADDVKCSHGSTIGQLDEDPLFYLRSRGLSEAQARELLMQAFMYEVMDKIMDENIRDSIKDIAGGWLKAALK